jgi:hypothetical protein
MGEILFNVEVVEIQIITKMVFVQRAVALQKIAALKSCRLTRSLHRRLAASREKCDLLNFEKPQWQRRMASPRPLLNSRPSEASGVDLEHLLQVCGAGCPHVPRRSLG